MKRGETRSILTGLNCEGDCIVWTGGRTPSGYGTLTLIPGTRNCKYYLHRASWEIHNERPVPPGLVVRHKCDNPPCINPDHLEIGTYSDNFQDPKRHGKAFRPNAIIYQLDVPFFKANPELIEAEAKRLGVGVRYLKEIVSGSRKSKGLRDAHVSIEHQRAEYERAHPRALLAETSL